MSLTLSALKIFRQVCYGICLEAVRISRAVMMKIGLRMTSLPRTAKCTAACGLVAVVLVASMHCIVEAKVRPLPRMSSGEPGGHHPASE